MTRAALDFLRHVPYEDISSGQENQRSERSPSCPDRMYVHSLSDVND